MNPLAPVIVTGGAGFIGSHLVERLLHAGHSVVVIDNLSTGSLANLHRVQNSPNLEIIPSSISQCPDLPRRIANASAIFHLAAAVGVELVVRSPLQTMRTNLIETEILLEAAQPCQTPILLASTSEVYGRSPKTSFSEADDLVIGSPQIARWSYACSKLMDEFLALAHAREHLTPATIIRFFNIVGPRQKGDYGMVLPRFVQAALTNSPLRVYGDGLQTRCFCHVRDAVEAVFRLWKSPLAKNEIVNVGGREMVTILALAELVIQRLGSKSSIERVPYAKAFTAGFEDMLHRQPALEKLQSLTGYLPQIPLSQIIDEVATALQSPPC